MIAPPMASDRVAGYFVTSSELTGVRVVYEMPRHGAGQSYTPPMLIFRPVKMPFTHTTYCSVTGLLNPISSVSTWSFSAVHLPFRSHSGRAGSTGPRKNNAKTNIDVR